MLTRRVAGGAVLRAMLKGRLAARAMGKLERAVLAAVITIVQIPTLQLSDPAIPKGELCTLVS